MGAGDDIFSGVCVGGTGLVDKTEGAEPSCILHRVRLPDHGLWGQAKPTGPCYHSDLNL